MTISQQELIRAPARREAELATEGEGAGRAGEVDRLRVELTELREQLTVAHEETAQAQQETARARRDAAHAAGIEQAERASGTRAKPTGWRGPVAALLIVLGCVLAPVSVVAVWTANQLSDTSRYVANVQPLITEPAVKGALTDKISNAVSAQIDVQAVADKAAAELSSRGLTRLGALISNFSGPIASGVNGLIHSTVARIIDHPLVARLWVNANRLAHTQLVKALSGQKSALSISNGKVVIGLGPFIDQVKHKLAARGLTLVNKLPAINPTFPLFSAKYLVQARTLYSLLNTLKWVLPLLTLVLLAAGAYVARRHRRALVGVGLGVAGSMLVLGAALAIARAIYLNKIPASVLPADAAAVVFDTLVRFIKEGLRVLLLVGLIVAFAAFFTGPSITAVRTRQAFTSGFGWIRGTGERAGLSTGPVGSWTFRYRKALRIGAVAVAVLAFVFWSDPTGLVVVTIALILLLVLGLIELIGRPPRPAAG